MTKSNIDIGNLDISQGIKLMGASEGDRFGIWSSVGDINNDGYEDIVIAADQFTLGLDAYNGPKKGKIYVFWGGSSISNIDTSNFNLSQGIVITGASDGDYIGSNSVCATGDINGDGFKDIIFDSGAGERGSTSKVYIIWGRQFSSNIDLANLGNNGIIIYEESGSSLGHDISTINLNKDGYDDIIISAPRWSADTGKIYIIWGKSSLSSINLNYLGNSGISITGSQPGAYLGYDVDNAGDVNGDGNEDILIGAAYYSSANLGTGISYLIWGSTTLSNINLSNLGNSGITIIGVDGDRVGARVKGNFDFNNDGKCDLLLGATNYNNHQGKVYLIYGRDDLSNINLANLGDMGMILTGENQNDDFGWDVSSAGDFNSDGYDDLLIGSSNYPNYGGMGKGYIIFGNSNSNLPLSVSMSSATLEQVISINSDGGRLGYGISNFGDINGDGVNDFVTGAQDKNSRKGEAYIIFGKPDNSKTPTLSPTPIPTAMPTLLPTKSPTAIPTTAGPTNKPTLLPTMTPSLTPTSIYKTIDITEGGTYSGTLARENFIINSPLSVTVTGDAGIDMFRVLPNVDETITITDFDPTNERIDLTSFTSIHKKSDLNITADPLVINLPDNQRIKLLNLSPSQIATGNFIFAPSYPTSSPTFIAATSTQSANKVLTIGDYVGIGIGIFAFGSIVSLSFKACADFFWPKKIENAVQTKEQNNKDSVSSAPPLEIVEAEVKVIANETHRADPEKFILRNDDLENSYGIVLRGPSETYTVAVYDLYFDNPEIQKAYLSGTGLASIKFEGVHKTTQLTIENTFDAALKSEKLDKNIELPSFIDTDNSIKGSMIDYIKHIDTRNMLEVYPITRGLINSVLICFNANYKLPEFSNLVLFTTHIGLGHINAIQAKSDSYVPYVMSFVDSAKFAARLNVISNAKEYREELAFKEQTISSYEAIKHCASVVLTYTLPDLLICAAAKAAMPTYQCTNMDLWNKFSFAGSECYSVYKASLEPTTEDAITPLVIDAAVAIASYANGNGVFETITNVVAADWIGRAMFDFVQSE